MIADYVLQHQCDPGNRDPWTSDPWNETCPCGYLHDINQLMLAHPRLNAEITNHVITNASKYEAGYLNSDEYTLHLAAAHAFSIAHLGM